MAQQAPRVTQSMGPPRLLLVDEFASPRRYKSGKPGVPLLLLDAITECTVFP